MTLSGNMLWLLGQPLILASGSSTRRSMLEHAGVPVDMTVPDVDERAFDGSFAYDQGTELLAQVLATAKALDVSARRPDRLVLGADQTLTLAGEHLHKATNIADARSQLNRLQGRSHMLTSAFAVVRNGNIVGQGHAIATMTMRSFDEAFLDGYLDQAGTAILGSVGCYQIEGPGLHLFEHIEGDHFTILGLPMLQVLSALRVCGAIAE